MASIKHGTISPARNDLSLKDEVCERSLAGSSLGEL